jgi:dTDP-4-dehydrorhamnose reductase
MPLKIFIAGASGLLGSNCLKHFMEQGCEVVGSYYSYATDTTVFYDTLNESNAKNFDVVTFAPDVIVHCGALTHVDYCETNEQESYEKTVLSTKNLIALASKINAKLVFISTDYVFDGKAGPYAETDSVNPLSVYAKHKLEAEQASIAANDKNLILRITNVYGNEARNKNFVARIMEQCKAKQKLNLTLPTDQYATPVNAWDVARAMLLLLQDGHSGIFHIASTDWMNRVELAMNIIKNFPGADYVLNPISTAAMQQPAARPLMGGLLKNKFSALYPTFIFSTVQDFVQENL